MQPTIKINDTVTRWPCGKYSVCVNGKEIPLRARYDDAAIKEGEKILKELQQ